jgi:hypothetical protein
MMTHFIDTTSKRRVSAKLAAGLAISAILALGAFAAPASADWNDGYYREYHHHNWNGGYYRAPPVVYGSPYGGGYYGSPYYAPPVVYGPSVGINLGGFGIGIR